MALSLSGVATLTAVALAGPLAWLVVSAVHRRRRLHQVQSPTSAAAATVAAASRDTGAQRSGRGTVDDSKATDFAVGDVAPEAEREEVSGVEYLLGQLGYAIGIGNLWRFPFLVGRWGGGAFIVAYLTCLFCVGIPVYLMEVFIGQYIRESTIRGFKKIHPRWVGLAIGMTMRLFIFLTFYNMVIAYAVVYAAGSLFDPLPWADDSASYWHGTVLNDYGGEYEGHGLGPVQWRLAAALLFVWVSVFFSVAFGKHVLARITWVTVVLPVVLLTILLARVVMLEGAKDGLEFYMGRFDVEVLKDLNMWAAACSQILYSLGQGSGCVITLSSFTKPKHNVFRSCMITALSNSAFSLVGGVAIFSLVGNIAYSINAAGGVLDPATGQMVPTSVAEQAQSGQGLAFIVIANGMQFFGSGANVMSALFFAMLFLLGLDSTYGNVETLVCIAEDLAADWMGLKLKRWMTAAGTCATLFLLGLLYCTRIGNDLLDVTDHYVQGYFILFGIALEAVMFVVDFGWRRLVVHSRLSTLLNAPDAPAGKDLSPFWRFTMCVVVPAVCAVLFASQLAADMREAYQGYPHGLLASGWTLIGIMVATTLFGGAWAWCRWGTSSLVPVEQEEMRLKEALESPGARVRV